LPYANLLSVAVCLSQCSLIQFVHYAKVLRIYRNFVESATSIALQTYATLSEIILSTSTLSSPVLNGGGFGPVNKKCFGIGYGVRVSNGKQRFFDAPTLRRHCFYV
jgi:hypothetical protein